MNVYFAGDQEIVITAKGKKRAEVLSHFPRNVGKKLGGLKAILQDWGEKPGTVLDLMARGGFNAKILKKYTGALLRLNDGNQTCFEVLRANFPEDLVSWIKPETFRAEDPYDLTVLDFPAFTIGRFPHWAQLFDGITSPHLLMTDSAAMCFHLNLKRLYGFETSGDYYKGVSDALGKHGFRASRYVQFGPGAWILAHRDYKGKLREIPFKKPMQLITDNADPRLV